MVYNLFKLLHYRYMKAKRNRASDIRLVAWKVLGSNSQESNNPDDNYKVEGRLNPGLFNLKLQLGPFNPILFNHELFNPMVQIFTAGYCWVEKFMVEK
jgi:hypothetical protein